MEQLLNNLRDALTINELEESSKQCTDYFLMASETEKEELKRALLTKTQQIIANSVQTRREAEKLLMELEENSVIIEVNGQKYPLQEWVTIQQYCKKMGLNSTSIVTNWIKRGIIPDENILRIKQLNNLKLIKDLPYRG